MHSSYTNNYEYIGVFCVHKLAGFLTYMHCNQYLLPQVACMCIVKSEYQEDQIYKRSNSR